MARFAATPQPPYYVVTFSSQLSDDTDGYGKTAGRMVELALAQPGCLGVESTRDRTGFGITLAFFESEEAIRAWKRHSEHAQAQRMGRTAWYQRYQVRVARVERAYEFER